MKRPRSPSSECNSSPSTISDEQPRQKRICPVRDCPEPVGFRGKWLARRALRPSQRPTRLNLSAYSDNTTVVKRTIVTVTTSPKPKQRPGSVSPTHGLTIFVPQRFARSLSYGVMHPELTRRKSGSCPSTVLKPRNGRPAPCGNRIQGGSGRNGVTIQDSNVPCKASRGRGATTSGTDSKPDEGDSRKCALGTELAHRQGPIDQWLEKLPQNQEGYDAVDKAPATVSEGKLSKGYDSCSLLETCLLCSSSDQHSHFSKSSSRTPLTKPISKKLERKSKDVTLGNNSKVHHCNYLPCKMIFSSVDDLLEHQR